MGSWQLNMGTRIVGNFSFLLNWFSLWQTVTARASQVALVVKNLPANAADGSKRRGFNPRVGKIPGGGNGNPPQYSCLENPMDRGAWQARVHRVTKSQA